MYKSLLVVSLFSLSASAMSKEEAFSCASKAVPVLGSASVIYQVTRPLSLAPTPSIAQSVIACTAGYPVVVTAAAVYGTCYLGKKVVSHFTTPNESK
ncbi:MAG: hypothetical protein P4L31_06340 [Candidatus Babeliales bacterium]|nr:hypothetical protein [Candidatus Babeliales bacterium]